MSEILDNGSPITIWPSTEIKQTANARLKEAIRLGGMRWHREHNPHWRDDPWKDGITVDLDEPDVVDLIAEEIVRLTQPGEVDDDG